jgi:hypothetical protein
MLALVNFVVIRHKWLLRQPEPAEARFQAQKNGAPEMLVDDERTARGCARQAFAPLRKLGIQVMV